MLATSDVAESLAHALGFTVPYAIGNILLTMLGPAIVVHTSVPWGAMRFGVGAQETFFLPPCTWGVYVSPPFVTRIDENAYSDMAIDLWSPAASA